MLWPILKAFKIKMRNIAQRNLVNFKDNLLLSDHLIALLLYNQFIHKIFYYNSKASLNTIRVRFNQLK